MEEGRLPGRGASQQEAGLSETPLRTGGEWIVEALRAQGVRHIFGLPGVHNLAIYDALFRQHDIAHILSRHEQGAGFMADGYARSSGRPGVVVVTTGPGATNVLTPLVESFADGQPILVLMSDIPTALIGKGLGALHEVANQIDCFKPVCCWAETIFDAREIPAAVARAFHLFRTGRQRPIALSLPTDLLVAKTEGRRETFSGGPPMCDPRLIEDGAKHLRDAKRPLIVAGGGVISARASAELTALAHRLDAPVITSVMGRGSIPETDPLWVGVLPNYRSTQAALEQADVVLAVGCRFTHRSTKGLMLKLDFKPEQSLIHLDIDPSVIGLMHPAAVAIVGDARNGLSGLLDALGTGAGATEWDAAWIRAQREIRWPRYTQTTDRLMTMLRHALPPEGIVVNDQTGLNYWMEWHFPVLEPRTFLYPVGSATLGYGVPAAIGAKVAHPDRPVLAVLGDGGFMFSVNELATAVKYGLGVVFLVLNDQRYGAIQYLQERMFGKYGEVDLVNPDFPAMARAFGAVGHRVEGLDELPKALGEALTHGGPTLLELPIAVDPPWEVERYTPDMVVLDAARKQALRRELTALLGKGSVLSEPEELLVYESDGLVFFRALADFVVFPTSTEQVSAVVKLANREGLPFVARGAGTGLSGGCLPAEGGLVISLMRLNRVVEVDYDNQIAVVEPGLVNLHLSWAVGPKGFYYAPDPSSQQACTVGGNIANNSGGPHTLKYGVTANHVLGLEVVLPDGEIMWLGGRTREAQGYDVVGLFVGSEGTFGIATKIVVRILKQPQAVKTVLAVFDSIEQASEAVSAVIARGLIPAAMEMIDQLTIGAVEDAFGCGYPRDAAAALLIELDGLRHGLDAQAERVMAACRDCGARDVRAARDEAERQLLWKGRKSAFGAYGHISPAYMVMDGVIPRTRLPEVLRRVNGIAASYGLRVGNVFHAGDGNLHPNILYDPRVPGEEARVVAAGGEILKVCADVGGSISGEHGIGLEKIDYMSLIFSEADLDFMGRLRVAFNPRNLCNPGKIFPSRKACSETGPAYRKHPIEEKGLAQRF